MADEEGTIIEATEHGIIAAHAPRRTHPFFASTATAETFNVLGLDIVPIACVNLGDILFDFDSSFVLPPAGKVVGGIPALRESRKNTNGDLPPLSIFGHADPVGDIEYNKQLSGRRAKAVFGLLTHDTAIWDELFNAPHGGDNWQTNAPVKGIRTLVGLPSSASRKDAFAAYMAMLCPTPLAKSDFLGRGADPKGKADFQGCSEFNQLVLLSKEDNQKLTTAQRNAANLLNRRVVIYLFRPGSKVTPSLWPCPAALDSTAACQKRLYADAKERMTPGPERREHTKVTDKTFACRFYDRIGGASPCERVLKMYRIRLFDVQARPLAGAPFFLEAGSTKLLGRTNGDAFITVRDLKVPTAVLVRWNRPAPGDSPASPPPDPKGKFEFMLNIFVDIDDKDETQAAENRLHNLGYIAGPKREDDVRRFQTDYKPRFGLAVTGVLDAETKAALETVNDECDPVVKPSPSK